MAMCCMLNLMMKTKRRIDELVWQHNKERAIEALYDDEMAMVDNYTTRRETSDCRAK